MDAARGEDLGLVVARRVGPLLPRQDVEVVVRGVAARVALGADRRPENDQVLRDACYAVGVRGLEMEVMEGGREGGGE